MRVDVLRPPTHQALRQLAKAPATREFYLAGGTAVALHLGHRESEDLDFFRPDPFEPPVLLAEIRRFADLRLRDQSAGTLHGELDEVKVLEEPLLLRGRQVDRGGVDRMAR